MFERQNDSTIELLLMAFLPGGNIEGKLLACRELTLRAKETDDVALAYLTEIAKDQFGITKYEEIIRATQLNY